MTGGTPLAGQYLYDPSTHVWSSPAVITGNPGNRSDGGAVYSPNLDAMVWYGGRTGGATYTSELVVMSAQ